MPLWSGLPFDRNHALLPLASLADAASCMRTLTWNISTYVRSKRQDGFPPLAVVLAAAAQNPAVVPSSDMPTAGDAPTAVAKQDTNL